MKHRIGILYICTGKYDVFWRDFFESCEKYFLNDCVKEYYVFTDSEKIYKEDECDRIHKVYQENLGWPNNTLMRFNMFFRHKDKLENCDYLFFMNANIKFIKEITSEEFLLSNDENLLMVKHPCFYNKSIDEFTYDRNKNSLAYIPYGKGEYYVQGALNGGRKDAFIKLIDKLNDNVRKDLKNNIVALWHDESHLNKYILGRKDVKILGPEYLYPEGFKLPFDAQIITRDKNKWGGHSGLRGMSKKKSIKSFIKKVINFNVKY